MPNTFYFVRTKISDTEHQIKVESTDVQEALKDFRELNPGIEIYVYEHRRDNNILLRRNS